MIITLRNRIKHASFRYIAFFIFVVIGVGMISIPSLMRQERAGGGTWAIKVNGEKISFQDFSQAIAEQSEFLAQIRAQYGQYADLLFQAMGWPTDPRALAADMLIKTTLMNQFANQLGIAIHPDYISESINDVRFAHRHLQQLVPAFLFDQNGSLNSEKVRMFLQHRGMSVKDFERKVENSLAQLAAVQFIATTTYVPDFDFQQEFIATKLGKQFSYLTFSFDSFLQAEKKNVINDEDAKIFYDKENLQRRRYWVSEKRDGIVWKFNAHNYNVSISDEQIQHYYDDNKANKYVQDPLKVEVRQITEKQLAQSPDMTLENVREELANDPASAWSKKWELLKPFARGEKKGTFEKEAFLLQKEGEISPVIETKEGKVIIQLVKRIPRTYKPLAAVRNEIKTILAEKQFKKNFVKDLKAVISQGDAHAVEALIAQKAGKKELVAGLIKNDTKLSQELFSLKKDEYGVFIEDNTGFVVLLTNIIERNLPAFESVKDIVKDDLHEERAHEALNNAVQAAQKSAVPTSFEKLAKEYNVPLQRTEMILPTDNKKVQDLDKKDLPARTMLNLDKAGTIFVHNGEQNSFLIRLDTIADYTQDELDKAKAEMEQNLVDNRMKMQVESIVASLHRNATIETNESTQLASEEYSE